MLHRFVLLWLLLAGGQGDKGFETVPYDGWYHNLAHPDWGGADTVLTRPLPAAYSDGVYQPSGNDRPNPRVVSEAVMNGWTGHGSYLNRTALLVFFGQQIVEEILDAQRPGCPPEYFNIPIPKNDPDFDPDGKGNVEIPFLRSRFQQRTTGTSPNVPREQINEITPWLDGGLVYGVSKAWTDALRSLDGGKLKSSEDGRFPAKNDIGLPMANPPPPRDHYLKDAKRFFMLGNPRGNENPFLLTFGVLLFRWHNVLAERFQQAHPDWDDERIFLTARNWVIATHQKIVLYDWLPAWLNDTIPEYTGYKSSLHPAISHEFQSAAMRFGHTLVPPGVYRRNGQCEFRNTSMATGFAGHIGLRVCNTYWNPQEAVEESDIDEILMGMTSQIAEREDNIITEDLRGKVFGPLDFSRRDLMALNIQRGRDHGLPDYNVARTHYGLDPITDWKDINPFLYDREPELFDKLSSVHGSNLSRVDIWTGGLLETTPQGPGPLFNAIIKNQFLRIRDGDRFWFENDKNGLFSEEERSMILNITLYDIIINVTNIGPDDIQKDVFHWQAGDPCPQPKQLNQTDMEPCTKLQTYDYFDGSEKWFIGSFSAVAVFILCLLLFVFFGFIPCKIYKKKIMMTKMNKIKSRSKVGTSVEDIQTMKAVEWRGKDSDRNVQIKFGPGNAVHIKTSGGGNVRSLNFDNIREVTLKLASDNGQRMVVVSFQKEYDLALIFDNEEERTSFVEQLCDVLDAAGVQPTQMSQSQRVIKRNVYTYQKRQKKLEKFFRILFHKVSKQDFDLTDMEKDHKIRDILECELTLSEFAESLSMKCDDDFVQQMFTLADKDNSGYISFQEFFQLVVIFYRGTTDEKCKMLFDLYDFDGSGKLHKHEFTKMMKNTMALISADVSEENINDIVDMMYQKAEPTEENELTFDDFMTALEEYKDNFENATLPVRGVTTPTNVRLEVNGRSQVNGNQVFNRRTFIGQRNGSPDSGFGDRQRVRPLTTKGRSPTKPRTLPPSYTSRKMNSFLRYMENNKLQIFYLFIYFCVVAGIFIERAYFFSIEREHRGLRRIAGYGVTVTRGAASVIMFTMSALLVTMCRNLITHLRGTALSRFIPFDSSIRFHKIIAGTLLVFTCVHVTGHGINFYHISTQTADDLTCLFRDYFHKSDELPKFQYWLFSTTTGITGVMLVVVMVVLMIFALPWTRRHVYKAFWVTHKLYIPMYILTLLHGSGRLVIEPIFHYFLLGPAILFVIDKLVSVSRKTVEVSLVKAEILPSGVTYLEWKRPPDFEYKSGQWIRLSSKALGEHEYHPFTLTTAPHEDKLSVHVRALGPWTMNLQQKYDPDNLTDGKYPKLYLDGPFGEGHQDWHKYDVCVLVGAGIGVTPFASILKDVVHRKEPRVKKVYFLWVTRTQHQFEWMMDILRSVERDDENGLVDTHIFITQFYQKFDLRTTMLYICERNFQTMSNKSLFTGLQAVTHFGRPDFYSILDSVQGQHEVDKIGVFSCGPPSVTSSVEDACSELNSHDEAALFAHYYENF